MSYGCKKDGACSIFIGDEGPEGIGREKEEIPLIGGRHMIWKYSCELTG